MGQVGQVVPTQLIRQVAQVGPVGWHWKILGPRASWTRGASGASGLTPEDSGIQG